MKRVIIAFGAGLLAISGCKEKAPYINLSHSAAAIDTTYVGAVPTAELHNVLIEDFTGASCTNCPAAHAVILNLQNTYNTSANSRVNVMSMHNLDLSFGQTFPTDSSKYDFRQTQATEVGDQVYGHVGAIPVGGINRLPLAGGTFPYQISRADWNDDVAAELLKTDSVNLAVASTWDNATRKASISVTISYPFATSTLQNLSIAIVEDGFIDWQEDSQSPSNYDTFYHFDDVFRGFVTASPFGDAILPAIPNKEPGRVCVRNYSYTLDSKYNAANCRVIAFVTGNDANSGRIIYQSKQAKLNP